jgi:hypothetical protein
MMADHAARAAAAAIAYIDVVRRMLDERSSESAQMWLRESEIVAAGAARSTNSFFEVFTIAAQRLGRAPLQPRDDESARLHAAG